MEVHHLAKGARSPGASIGTQFPETLSQLLQSEREKSLILLQKRTLGHKRSSLLSPHPTQIISKYC